MLKRCSFPGNVRELENCVRRAATLMNGEVIGREDLSCAVGECLSSQLWTGGGHGPFDPIAELASGAHDRRSGLPASCRVPVPTGVSARASLRRRFRPPTKPWPRPASMRTRATVLRIASRLTEKERLLDAMERAGWVQAKAARILNVTPRQIGYALRKYRIEMKHF